MDKYLAIKTNKVAVVGAIAVITLEANDDLEKYHLDDKIGENIVFINGNGASELGELTQQIGVLGKIEQVLVNAIGTEVTVAVDITDYVMFMSCEDGAKDIGMCEAVLYTYSILDANKVTSLTIQAEEAYKMYLYEMDHTALSFNEHSFHKDDLSNFDRSNIIKTIDNILLALEEPVTSINTMYTVEDRLCAFISDIKKAQSILNLDTAVETAVANAAAQNQREFYAREKIKALTEELDGENEVEEYLELIEELDADDKTKEKLSKEARKINKTSPSSPDMAILKNYLDTALELPWREFTKDNADLSRAEKVLNEDHFGLEKVKERLLEALAVRKLSDTGRSPIICLVGPPGTGKTSIAESIARAMNKKFVRLSLGGIKDEADIRGHRKTYVGAMPGRIIDSIRQAGSANPVFLMDEIDKMAYSDRGDPSSALLEVLDPAQNVSFRDHYIELPFDLSKVLFITTANDISDISTPLLDRMEVIELTGYTTPEKLEIAKRYLIPKAFKNNGIKSEWLKLTDSAVIEIIDNYTRESGVRGLEKKINAVARKIARKNVDAKKHSLVKINTNNLSKYLGEPKNNFSNIAESDEVGYVTGLAWTAVGGVTLQIEVSLMKGKGSITLTGNLGDVMKESANIAVSYCRSNAIALGIDEDFYSNYDIHIHVPEGATPKDGPSAGVTITTALVSALTNKKIDRFVGMTGEITLRGKVLGIGGLKEKCLAAVRAGVKKVYVPLANKRDHKELPESVKQNLEFVFVSDVNEILNGAIKNDN